MSDAIPQDPLETMGSSSDSGTASSGSDSDHQRTPSPAAPRIRANADWPYTAPSRIPKMSTAVTHPLSHSRPATPIDSGAASASLNWGGGDWSLLAEDIERKSTEMLPILAEHGVLSEEASISKRDGGQMTTPDTAIVQSPTKLSGSFSDHECTSTYDAGHAPDSSESEDSTRTAPALRAVDQPSSATEVLHAETIPETELSDTDASHASGSDESVTQNANQPLCGPKNFETATMPNVELSDSDASNGYDSAESVVQDIDQPTFETKDSDTANILETELSDRDVSPDPDSDVSIIQLPTVRNHGPFLNIAMQDRPVKTSFGPSPQTILRGLVRDAHREMMYFTLPHSQFSLDDLRQGLDFAYSMLQAVASRLAILNSLQDMNDTDDMSAADLRRWIALVDYLDPQTRNEPRILAIFESLSAGKLKIALTELVQSRIVVEVEVKQTRALLMDLVIAKEERLRVSTPTVSVAADHDKGPSGCSSLCAFLDAEEPSWDALLTAIMVALVGALYISVRE